MSLGWAWYIANLFAASFRHIVNVGNFILCVCVEGGREDVKEEGMSSILQPDYECLDLHWMLGSSCRPVWP